MTNLKEQIQKLVLQKIPTVSELGNTSYHASVGLEPVDGQHIEELIQAVHKLSEIISIQTDIIVMLSGKSEALSIEYQKILEHKHSIQDIENLEKEVNLIEEIHDTVCNSLQSPTTGGTY